MSHQQSRSKMWRASNVTRAAGSKKPPNYTNCLSPMRSLSCVELGRTTRAGVQTGSDVARHRRFREVIPEKLARPCLITRLDSDSANKNTLSLSPTTLTQPCLCSSPALLD